VDNALKSKSKIINAKTNRFLMRKSKKTSELSTMLLAKTWQQQPTSAGRKKLWKLNMGCQTKLIHQLPKQFLYHVSLPGKRTLYVIKRSNVSNVESTIASVYPSRVCRW